MRIRRFEQEQFVRLPVHDVFDFFSRARNLERITPPFLSFEVVTPEPIAMRAGTRIEYRLRLHGLPLRWVSQIEDWQENRAFVDRQVRGPYRLWHHRHEFEPREQGTVVRDVVHYAIPFGGLGDLVAGPFVSRDLRRIFDYRRQTVAACMR